MAEQKPTFDKTAFCFEYPVVDVVKAINATLDAQNLDDYHLNMIGGLLTACGQYEIDGYQTIPLSASESMTIGLFNKRSAAASKREKAKKEGAKASK